MSLAAPLSPYKAGSHQSALLDSDPFIWFIAIALSLVSHAVFFFQQNIQYNAVPAMVIQKTITQVRFANILPPPVKVIEPEVKKPKPKPIVLPKKIPQPIVKKKMVKKKPEPKPKKKKKPAPDPIRKKTRKPPVKVSTIVPEPQAVLVQAKPPINSEIKPSPIISTADQRLLKQTRKSYHALLMRHIEVHKHYPRTARKRKIEGKILVTFTLFANGSINTLLINGKRSILKKATADAIKNALPMPRPPTELTLPLKIKFTMDYFLK